MLTIEAIDKAIDKNKSIIKNMEETINYLEKIDTNCDIEKGLLEDWRINLEALNIARNTIVESENAKQIWEKLKEPVKPNRRMQEAHKKSAKMFD